MTIPTQGQIADKPLGELIRELGQAGVSGALRLSRDRAKAVVYLAEGTPIFAASNIRAHRLSEFLKRAGIANDELLAQTSPTATDEEVLKLLVARGKIRSNQAADIKANLVAEILRVTLLWTEGDWQFDARVKLAGDMRVTVDAPRLLLESTRHLPAAYIASRFPNPNEQLYATQTNGNSAILLPAEAFVASRLSTPMTIAELEAASGLGQEETLRAIYALVMSGTIARGAWKGAERNGQTRGRPASAIPAEPKPETVQEFLARIDKASDFYALLDVGRSAGAVEIKNAYHGMARRYHPDRFHQVEPALRTRIESAFAQVARAYETLTNAASRSAYDAQLSGAAPTSKVSDPPPASAARVSQQAQTPTAGTRAAASYEKGLAALKQNQPQLAVRFFAEAAHLEPRCARYRAEYGRTLTSDPQTRRIAEVELKAAIALEPANTSYRVMLAELYKALGLRRRAEGELQRALLADPKSETARTLLASLKK